MQKNILKTCITALVTLQTEVFFLRNGHRIGIQLVSLQKYFVEFIQRYKKAWVHLSTVLLYTYTVFFT